MKTARNFVAIVVELAASVQHGHDDLRCGDAFFLVDIYGNPATVILYGYAIAAMYRDFDLIAMTCKSFINGIVDKFLHHVMQSCAVLGITYIHSGTLADRGKAFQYLDIL